MQIGNRFRCYPTPAQEQTLLQWIGCQRHIYNAKVREEQYYRRFARKSLQHVGQYSPIDQQYSQFKTELTPYLSEVPGVLLRNGAVLWKQAYSRYFSRLGGRPVIHQRHGKQSVWLTSEVFKFVPVVDTETGEITGHQLSSAQRNSRSGFWHSRHTRISKSLPRCTSVFTLAAAMSRSTTTTTFPSQPTKTPPTG